jgi:pyrroline-5-carboxylate reductase
MAAPPSAPSPAPDALPSDAPALAGRTLAVLGCGTMGEAIVGGLLRGGFVAPAQVRVSARSQRTVERLRGKLGVFASTDNLVTVQGADVALVAVKPSYVGDVLDHDAMRAALAGRLVISIAAGVRIPTLARWLPAAHVVRAMPNTPALIGAGMTVLARGDTVPDHELERAAQIFRAVGRVVELDDRLMDAVTSLNGSGPAFVYVMLEAMADGGVMMGLPRDTALEIAAQVFAGAASMVLATGFHPAALKDQVTTPAGSTIAGLLTMEDGRIRSVLARTVQEATKVAAGLGRPPGTSD